MKYLIFIKYHKIVLKTMDIIILFHKKNRYV